MHKKHYLSRFTLAVVSGLLILPLILTVLYSFFAPAEIRNFMQTRNQYGEEMMEVKLIPSAVSLKQFRILLIDDISILRYCFNSLFYTVVILVGQLCIVPSMAYALSQFRFHGRDFLAFSMIILFLLPFQVTMVPNVLTLQSLNLMNSPWAVILPALTSPFYIFLLRQNMMGMPSELFEAAQIDGAGPIRCFFSIALPISKPMLGAFVALSFAECWNMVEQPLAFLPSSADWYPLSLLFNQLSQESNGIEFAGATLYLLPALFVYMIFQQDILDGIQMTDLK